jgi:hemerythrin-like metal-binding protein
MEGLSMSTISDFNTAAQAGMDREHEVQLSLLRTLCQAIREQRKAEEVAQLLDQFSGYCEAHFVSEELIMRQHSFEEYEDHADDHCHMMDLLKDIATSHTDGNTAGMNTVTDEALAFIENHISTRDRRFADFLHRAQ